MINTLINSSASTYVICNTLSVECYLCVILWSSFSNVSGFFQRYFNTRNSVNLVLRSTYNHKKKISQQSIRIAGPRTCNNFPVLCKSSISLHSLKKTTEKIFAKLKLIDCLHYLHKNINYRAVIRVISYTAW